eukprot:CAMPEP_0206616264 /NCGR_PEP_ID=MMETSP0325_2-20121206/58872_1 /ASSEMBLY_ACC=CAM_ASM_000347 /TAXON_ID=2866 /ORGANISM="Crypthecodinium cohnii, Strain Seligo" /LENGTH=128 /DNA_ID=CAMNT_0054137895 /DNA_START=307 /DNA_END=690 /DNA_ORIENTATION=+
MDLPDLQLLQGLAPTRISCAVYHSACVGNYKAEDSGDQPRAECYYPESEYQVYGWGRNIHGCFGKDKVEVTAPAAFQSAKPGFRPLQGVTEVSCGSNHTVFLVCEEPGAPGVVYGCGLGAKGRLGISE